MPGLVSIQDIVVTHCGQPMRWVRDHVTWSGENEVERVDLRCEQCGATATVDLVSPVGPPNA